jgi:integrating conjugative element membrane protein (TIGR03745 family)
MAKPRQTLFHLANAVAVLFMGPACRAWAQLPTPAQPSSGGGNNGNWLDILKSWGKDGVIVLAALIVGFGFLWVANHFLADLHEVRIGKKEKGELVVNGILGAVVIVMVIVLANQAVTVID